MKNPNFKCLQMGRIFVSYLCNAHDIAKPISSEYDQYYNMILCKILKNVNLSKYFRSLYGVKQGCAGIFCRVPKVGLANYTLPDMRVLLYNNTHTHMYGLLFQVNNLIISNVLSWYEARVQNIFFY